VHFCSNLIGDNSSIRNLAAPEMAINLYSKLRKWMYFSADTQDRLEFSYL
jgi:hypothetical protein